MAKESKGMAVTVDPLSQTCGRGHAVIDRQRRRRRRRSSVFCSFVFSIGNEIIEGPRTESSAGRN